MWSSERDAGFSDIEIISETNFGAQAAAFGPMINSLARDTGIPLEEVAAQLGKVTSLTLRLTRPGSEPS